MWLQENSVSAGASKVRSVFITIVLYGDHHLLLHISQYFDKYNKKMSIVTKAICLFSKESFTRKVLHEKYKHYINDKQELSQQQKKACIDYI